jgi:uncharacterized protein (TIGR02217 family)
MRMFSELRFPSDIAFGASGGPEFATQIVTSVSGHEQRNSQWQHARIRFNAAYGIKSHAQLDHLLAFFRAHRGKAIGFRFKDHTDYRACDQQIGRGDGQQCIFQLIKHYPHHEVPRTITKPVTSTICITLDGTLVADTEYRVDANSGQITFCTPPAPATKITASFEFDIPMRFDTDQLMANLDGMNSYSWHDIPLIEIRE